MNANNKTWSLSQLPDLQGKTYLITGGNSGLGLETAKHLGAKGADLILACRSLDKASKAKAQLEPQVSGKVDLLELDLSDLSSVRRASEDVHERYDRLDALINNAGIMQCPEQKTKDGFEMQVGTNHLGHFLLSGLLLDRIEAAQGRIVTVSSMVTRMGHLNFRDYMSTQAYSPSTAYIQSKLSNLLFALELDRRLEAAGSSAISLACHPGYSATNLQSTGPKGLLNFIYKFTNALLAQPPSRGAEPTVLAAAGLEARRGTYYGPQRLSEWRGPAGEAELPKGANNKNDWVRLWEMSEDLVNFQWKLSPRVHEQGEADAVNSASAVV